MDHTSCGNECPLVKSGVCKTEKECCNYVENWWIPNSKEKPVIIKDCAPKRLLMMQQDQVNYTLNLQQSVNELKEEVKRLSDMLTSLINQTHVYLREEQEKNLLSYKD